MTNRKLEKLFNDYCFERKTIHPDVVANWCKKYYPDFLEGINPLWDFPRLFFYDFFVDYYKKRYSIYLTSNPMEVKSFENSFMVSNIGNDFIKHFRYTPIILTSIPTELDSIFSTVAKQNEKYYIF